MAESESREHDTSTTSGDTTTGDTATAPSPPAVEVPEQRDGGRSAAENPTEVHSAGPAGSGSEDTTVVSGAGHGSAAPQSPAPSGGSEHSPSSWAGPGGAPNQAPSHQPHPGAPNQAPPDQGGPYQGAPYQGGQYQGGPYQGGQYQGGPYEGGPYQGAPYQGGQYQGGQYQGALYQGGPYQGGPYQGGQYQGGPSQGPPSGSFAGQGASWGAPPGQGPWQPAPPDQQQDQDGRRRRRWILVAVAAAVVLVVVVTTVVIVVRGIPDRTVREAAGGVQGWSGVTYRGQITDATGPATVELSVDNQGNGVGSITRSSGGRADIITTPSTQAIRGDAQWWARSAPRPALAVRLADRWADGARDQLAAVAPWAMSPAQLAGSLTQPGRWSGGDGQQVGGVAADGYTRGGDRVLIDDSGPQARLVGVDLGAFGGQRGTPVAVEQAAPDALSRVTATTTQPPSMQDYTTTVTQHALIRTTWVLRESPCRAAVCTADATLTSLNGFPVGGTAQFKVNDQPAGSAPFTLPELGTVTIPITFPNAGPPGQLVTFTGQVVPIDTD